MTPFKLASGLLSGVLFGAGLAVSGMTNPNKVLNFLDLTGRWDPSLLLVMGAAAPIAALAFRFTRRGRPLFETEFQLPAKTRLDAPLIVGSALFGLGWGLGGYCPGPAVASLAQPSLTLLGFLAAMAAGLALSGPVARRLARKD